MHVNYVEWHIHPFRADRWLEIWRPALDRALAFGARASYLTRNVDDPLHFRQVSVWESKDDFERFWASDDVAALREEAFNYFNKPVVSVWHSMTVEAVPGEEGAQGPDTSADQPADETVTAPASEGEASGEAADADGDESKPAASGAGVEG
jgi:heme-degrading monooxygenase HmoA